MRVLAAILRLAESLDRSHAQVVSGIALRQDGKALSLALTTASDAELEVWATLRHIQPFERVLRTPVRLEATSMAPP